MSQQWTQSLLGRRSEQQQLVQSVENSPRCLWFNSPDWRHIFSSCDTKFLVLSTKSQYKTQLYSDLLQCQIQTNCSDQVLFCGSVVLFAKNFVVICLFSFPLQVYFVNKQLIGLLQFYTASTRPVSHLLVSRSEGYFYLNYIIMFCIICVLRKIGILKLLACSSRRPGQLSGQTTGLSVQGLQVQTLPGRQISQ